MNRRRPESITKEEITKNYVNDLKATMMSCSLKLGCSYRALRKAMRIYEILPRPKTHNWRRKPSIPQLDDIEWLKKQLETKSMKQIAKDLNTSHGRVSYFVNKHSIEWRGKDKSEKVKLALKGKYPFGRNGELAGNWRGGRRKGGSGGRYILIYSPNHPYAGREGYMMEHRLVMEKKLGRFLKLGEYVHHINGDTHDNRPENLKLMNNRKEHSKIHFDAVKEVTRLEIENKKLRVEIERLKKTSKS